MKLQLASHGGFGKTMKASVFGEKKQDVFTHDLRWFNMYLVIHHEHAGDLAQAVCVDSSSDYTRHGPCNESKEGGNEGHERSEGHDQGSALG